MKNMTRIVALAALLAWPGLCRGQAGGNIGYMQNGAKARAQQSERAKRSVSKDEAPPSGTSMFADANILMNVKADEYVAVFGVSRDAETVEECGRKVDAAVKEFSEALKPLAVAGADVFVDFVAQNPIYGFEVTGDIAREKLVGFDMKKNVSIHYRDYALLDKLIVAAAKAKVYDLIKVDYVVKDTTRINDRLMKEAARVIKHKTARYEELLGIKVQPPAQVYAEKTAVYYPTQMYDFYTAQESEEIGSQYYRQKYTVHSARKGRTFFYNGLDGDGFDEVIDPVIVEPVVQFTLYLKVRYEVEQAKAK